MLYEKIPNLIYECSFVAANESLLVVPKLILRLHGFKDDEVSVGADKGVFFIQAYTENRLLISTLKKNVSKLKDTAFKFKVKNLRPAQWLTRWKTHWKPLSLTPKVDVIPAWYQGKYKTKKKVILLDTLMSFGTGMHETTQLISRLLEKNAKGADSLIDIGTGTGILAILALKLGIKDVVAMDISPLSIDSSKKNLEVNQLKANLFLGDIGKLSLNKKYDMVVANLITDDLIKFRKKIIQLVNPKKDLLISGISLENLKRLKAAFKNECLTLKEESKGKQWAALHYVKKT